jgi:peptide-methionine (R)-S-oxide reductase
MSIKLVKWFVMVLMVASINQLQAQSKPAVKKTEPMEDKKVIRSEEEWKKILTPQQYQVLREKGTDAPHTGKYTLHKETGMYICAACGNELFSSDMKFDSHCGWPSFDREIAGGKITTKTDTSYGMVRTEILCGKCGSHLGHLFDDGPTDTGMRYCVNSTSLDFKTSSPKKEQPAQKKP